MIDPFGVKGVPMDTIKRIINESKSEIYISFMWEPVNRFSSTPEFAPHLDELYGCQDWIKGLGMSDIEERGVFWHGLYKKQLRKSGAKYLLDVKVRRDNHLVYVIFFGTNHPTGCDKMKQAIWKVIPTGDYTFNSGMDEQLTFGNAAIDYEPLHRSLAHNFKSQGWVSIEKIEAFMKSDQVLFHSGQLKTNALKPMEASGAIEIKDGTRKRKNTYPPRTMIRFISS